MAFQEGMALNPDNYHEVVLRELDDLGGCFLSDLGSMLGQRGLVFHSRDINDALRTAVKDGRFVLEFRVNGSHPDLFIRTRRYPSTSPDKLHNKNNCSSDVCNTCHPELFR